MKRVVRDEATALPPKQTMCTLEEGKTRQSEAQEADINYVIKKFDATGELPQRRIAGQFADVSSAPSLQSVLEATSKAKEAFASLPDDVRAYFRNDPQRLMAAWEAGEHAEIFEEIGWLQKLPKVEDELREDDDVKKESAKADSNKPA